MSINKMMRHKMSKNKRKGKTHKMCLTKRKRHKMSVNKNGHKMSRNKNRHKLSRNKSRHKMSINKTRQQTDTVIQYSKPGKKALENGQGTDGKRKESKGRKNCEHRCKPPRTGKHRRQLKIWLKRGGEGQMNAAD